MRSTKEQLLSCQMKRVRVKLPEFGLDLYVQEMNAEQRAEYYQVLTNALTNHEQKQDITAKILLPSLLDLDGRRLLADDDFEALGNLSPQVVIKLTNTLLQISGMSSDFFEAEKKRLQKVGNMRFFSNLRAYLVKVLQR